MKNIAMKKPTLKTFIPLSAVAAVFGLAASSAHAQPVFNYNFPASWNGFGTSGAVVTDQSSAGNNATTTPGLALATAVPSWATAGTESVSTVSSGMYTSNTKLLNNAAVWGAGGFTYNLSFMWNGAFSSSFSGIQKLIDYAGTESLQIVATSGNSATLEMTFTGDTDTSSGQVSTTILPNTWYNVTMAFDALTQTGATNQDVTGVAGLEVNGSWASVAPATKGTYGDTLARPIGVGSFGYPSATLIEFKGDIYNPSVSLGAVTVPVPEPSTLALGALGGLGMMMLRRRKS